jgi:hypothetical protein
MVAFSSSRRTAMRGSSPQGITVQGLPISRQGLAVHDPYAAGASRRSPATVQVVRDNQNEIRQVRIGRWRVLAAAPQRRVVEVKQVGSQRIAVRIERFADQGPTATSQIWQLYDREGRLEAALQSTPDGQFGILTDYVSRQSCRLVRNQTGEFEATDEWSL